MSECIFCKIIKGEKSFDKVFESENFLAFKDINEKALGHSLIVPKKHMKSFLELDSSLYSEFLETVRLVAEKIKDEMGCETFNFLINDGKAAGQVISHLHLHIVPRNTGDKYHMGPWI